jgi:hypothetical protein
MRNKCSAILLIPLFFWNPVHADENLDSAVEEKTMCDPSEQIYFSCPVGEKIISVCAAGNYSPETGYVKYRFGYPGKSEFEYPKNSAPPSDKFLISDSFGGNVSTVILKFRSEKFTYVVFQSAVSGVYVRKDGKTIGSLLCDAGQYSHISPTAMRGIKTVAPNDDD